MKLYKIEVHGDRYPIRKIIEAKDFKDAVEQSFEIYKDAFKMGRLKVLKIIIELCK